MTDPFIKTPIFRTDLKLETWFPEGVLDAPLARQMANYVGFEERNTDEPFNRFVDMSKLTAIHLTFLEIADLAALRRTSYEGLPPVKSAFFAPEAPANAVARLFALFMKPSPIHVRVFRNIENAAMWLEVPVEALRESGNRQP